MPASGESQGSVGHLRSSFPKNLRLGDGFFCKPGLSPACQGEAGPRPGLHGRGIEEKGLWGQDIPDDG